MARPRFEPTDEQRLLVKDLYGYGLPVEQVRQHVINPTTGKPLARQALFRAFRKELDAGQAIANGKILQTAFKIATDLAHDKCAAMNIFWQKTRMGFKETDRRELTGPDGEPLPIGGPQLVIKVGKPIEAEATE